MNDNFKLGTDYTDFTVLRDFAVKDRVNPCNPCLLCDFYDSVNRADFTSRLFVPIITSNSPGSATSCRS